MAAEAATAIGLLQGLGVQVLFTDNHHRKLAIIDGSILYEGSLNILSQSSSCEVMRRVKSANLATEMLKFIKISKFM